MKIWSLTKKDLLVLFKDRAAIVWVFILPVVIITIFALLARMSSGDTSQSTKADNRTPLAVVNLDLEGVTAKEFVQALNQAGGYRVVEYTLQDAEQAMNRIKVAHYLVIPANFTADLSQGNPVNLTLYAHPNTDPSTTQTILQVIRGVANNTSLELQILDGIREMGEMQANNPQAVNIFSTDRTLKQASDQFAYSRTTPLVTVVQQTSQVEKEQASGFNLGATLVPGMCVLFVFLSAQTVARSIYEERKAGSLRRLLAAPISRSGLLLGKLVPNLILTLIQIIFIFLVGATLLPTLGIGRLSIGDPLAWALASLAIALCATCLGILIAAIAKTEGQVSGVSNAILWVAGFLGGAILPTFMLQQISVLNVVSRFLPQSYASNAYYDILTRGKGLVDVWPDLIFLLGFAVLFFVIGARRFRFE